MWRKASYSQGASNCVEVGSWRKASYSNLANTCVEAGTGLGIVGVRDTTQAADPSRTVIEVPARAWRAFTRSLK